MGIDKDRMNKIREILKTLTKREENVLSLYFGIDKNIRSNFSEIGQDYDITVNTVKKIKNRGVRKLIFRLKTIKELTPLISHIDNGLVDQCVKERGKLYDEFMMKLLKK